MNKGMQIDIGGKEYILGYPTRKDVVKAEEKGLDVLGKQGKVISLSDKLFYTGLLAKHPTITESEASKLEEQYIEEGGDLEEIITFLSQQYQGFIKSQDKKKVKKAKIVEM